MKTTFPSRARVNKIFLPALFGSFSLLFLSCSAAETYSKEEILLKTTSTPNGELISYLGEHDCAAGRCDLFALSSFEELECAYVSSGAEPSCEQLDTGADFTRLDKSQNPAQNAQKRTNLNENLQSVSRFLSTTANSCDQSAEVFDDKFEIFDFGATCMPEQNEGQNEGNLETDKNIAGSARGISGGAGKITSSAQNTQNLETDKNIAGDAREISSTKNPAHADNVDEISLATISKGVPYALPYRSRFVNEYLLSTPAKEERSLKLCYSLASSTQVHCAEVTKVYKSLDYHLEK